jgi:hypothetical protein
MALAFALLAERFLLVAPIARYAVAGVAMAWIFFYVMPVFFAAKARAVSFHSTCHRSSSKLCLFGAGQALLNATPCGYRTPRETTFVASPPAGQLKYITFPVHDPLH